jgi:hypothetical protein
LSAQVSQYRLDYQRLFDAGNGFHVVASDTADLGVKIQHTLQALRQEPAPGVIRGHHCPAFNPHGFF